MLERHSVDGKGLTLRQLWGRYVISQQFEDKAEQTQKTEWGRIHATNLTSASSQFRAGVTNLLESNAISCDNFLHEMQTKL
ncbi:hypothetical protein QU481_03900 [Crenobacter sp. SG2303]|uniref:Uncharacterized protein n=1 Tax=Crenobacter oryzisoli TaxID=3056844 RepID=A0ABT7XJW1_9NEIS|nr:hypothetical protein [Crenobacter sp. SG2303]MDN0074030.1 hypothetical protein [Crenobacter sp. SG2303]